MLYVSCFMTMNKIFIISGPSGVGKTTIAKRALKAMPALQTTVTYSTRTKRLGKKEDKTIIHISQEDFRKKIDRGDFIEWAMVHENLYGTDKKTLVQKLKKSHVLMNIDVQGALQIKKKMPANTVLIFLKAQTIDELVKRITRREDMPKEILRIRINNAKKELAMGKKYDHIVLNKKNNIPETVRQVVSIISSYGKKQG